MRRILMSVKLERLFCTQRMKKPLFQSDLTKGKRYGSDSSWENRKSLANDLIIKNTHSFSEIQSYLNKVNFFFGSPEDTTQIRNKFTLYIPALIKEFLENKRKDYSFMRSRMRTISKLFYFCGVLKFFRKELFEAAYQVILKINQQGDIEQLTTIYYSLVNLWQQNQKVSKIVRQQIITKLKEKKLNQVDFNNLLSFFQAILLDNSMEAADKTAALQLVTPHFERGFASVLQSRPKILLQIHDMFLMEKLKGCQKLLSLLEMVPETEKKESKNLKRDQEVRRNFEEIDYKHASRFEIIFENKMKEMGILFSPNITIKGNEYDFLVKGYNRKKILPLAHIDIFVPPGQEPSFPLSTLQKAATSLRVDFLEETELLEEPVILELNGPIHEIDTDTALEYGHLRRELFKIKKLALHGIHKYNIIYFDVWEEKNRFPALSQTFIEDMIKNSKSTSSPVSRKPPTN